MQSYIIPYRLILKIKRAESWTMLAMKDSIFLIKKKTVYYKF